MWPFRWSCLLKAFEHIPQTYFRSSLWVSLCFARAEAFPNTLLQTWHCWGPCRVGEAVLGLGFFTTVVGSPLMMAVEATFDPLQLLLFPLPLLLLLLLQLLVLSLRVL